MSPNNSGSSPVMLLTASLEAKQSAKENCAKKNLFSTRGKPSFTQHPSLIKNSIESDRRKISSAPSSPVKSSKAESSLNSPPVPNKMAQLAAIYKMWLEEQSSEPRKKVKVNLARSGHSKPLAPLDPAGNTELELLAPSLIQLLGVVPLIPSPLSSAVPVILPQAPSGPSYTIYLQPTSQMLTPPHGLSPTVCPTQSCNATGSKDPTDIPMEKTATDATKSSASCRPGRLQAAPERQGAKNRSKEATGERGTKRTVTTEDSSSSSVKKAKEDLKELENVPTPTTLFPSGYLIPLTQRSSLGPDSVLSKCRKLRYTLPKPQDLGPPNCRCDPSIPAALSQLPAVNFPPFHVTPLKLKVSPTSMAAIPVGNSQALNSSHSAPAQNLSSAIVNFSLQHLVLISPSMQMSASPQPGAGTVPVSPGVEAASVIPDNLSSRQGRATNHDSPVLGQNQLNGQPVAGTGAQQPVPVTPKGSQLVAESFFHIPAGPTKPTNSSYIDFNGANRTSFGTLFVPQHNCGSLN